MEEQNNQTAVMMIEVGVTRQPKQYQSVRVGVNLPVFVRQEDNITVLLGDNLALAMWAVRQQVDDEFETYDEPAPYELGPRYMLLVCGDEQMMAIVPEQKAKGLPGGVAGNSYRAQGPPAGVYSAECRLRDGGIQAH